MLHETFKLNFMNGSLKNSFEFYPLQFLEQKPKPSSCLSALVAKMPRRHEGTKKHEERRVQHVARNF